MSYYFNSLNMYEFEKYATQPENVMDVLEQYGVAIIPSILSESECDAMQRGMWDTLEHVTSRWDQPISRDEQSSWRGFRELFPLHSMLIQHWSIGHAQYIWDIRQNHNIANVFANIWKCPANDLLVSFDAVSYHFPPEITKLGWNRGNTWYHCDQSFRDNSFRCVQGWVTAYDVNEGDATLSFLENSHKEHSNFAKHMENMSMEIPKDNWYRLSEEQLTFYQNIGCNEKRIQCPKGSLVLWDSRTIHCGVEALKTRKYNNFRNIAYICYEPRQHCDEKNIRKKQEAFENMRLTTHWPCNIKLFPKTPRAYGKKVLDMAPLPVPQLSALGRRLAGF